MYSTFQQRAFTIASKLAPIIGDGYETFSYNDAKNTFTLTVALDYGDMLYIIVGPFEESIIYACNDAHDDYIIEGQYLMPHQIHQFVREVLA